ncbi:hypothetical protein OGAPHI_007285 [Ogataea philodendri]|uniref:Uncharacterized protein n=1 Tax=Ogataea philodendri TaxID=1378263 RepID=A0A9P8SZP6_9ASCO|nr:uncharacterized protein OGAPHI_007285 [Ogataea philodendri]KAH3660080.1 hypothetical protein OGAPHI_007285 [Ogataea philodendri]
MSSRTLFSDYNGQKCYTLIESDAQQEKQVTETDDGVSRFLNHESLDGLGTATELKFTATFVCNEGRETYRGGFSSANHSSVGFLEALDHGIWTQWVKSLFVRGEFDLDYSFKVLDNGQGKKLVVTRDLPKNPGKVLFEMDCELADGDFFDVGEDLAVKYEQELELRRRIRELTRQNQQLQLDFEACQKINQDHVNSSKRLQDQIAKVVVPMFNEQKKLIRESLPERKFVPFESIRQDNQISWQRPEAPIEFEFDESRKSEYEREIEHVSPRKRKRTTTEIKQEPVDDSDETDVTVDDDSTISTNSD